MPTILIIKGYRFFFYSKEGTEPIHIHVEKADNVAKFWIEPLVLVDNYGFISSELNEILEIAEQNKQLIINKWNEHFSK